MAKITRLFVDGPYGQIHMRVAGDLPTDHPPLVCCHMFPQSGRNFEKFLEISGNSRLTIAADFPGYGESAAPEQQIRAQDYATAIWKGLDALSCLPTNQPIDIFGIHAGAKLATEIAHQRPEQVNRIALSSTAIFTDEELSQLQSTFSPIELDEAGSRFQYLWNILLKNRGEMSFEMLATALAEMLRGGEKYEWGHFSVFQYNSEFPDVIRSLPHPIAVLNPADDLYEITPRITDYLSNGILISRPDWGQGFLEIHAKDVVEKVHDFLDSPLEKYSLKTPSLEKH
ncbi:alpha/beta fold hydrolase [Hirschia maritima]|uniref:alpha/beta fold hydrolase n=1 Tax=Hirschia maritima TaxID=1121961 RepID=UPI00037FE788|nr:alpha/beta hydrolase [Hirschia maritima]